MDIQDCLSIDYVFLILVTKIGYQNWRLVTQATGGVGNYN